MPETLQYPTPPSGVLDTAQSHSEAPLWAAAAPLLSLLGVGALAFSAASKPGLADTVTLAALALMAALFAYAPFLRSVREDQSSASFALCAAFFVIYGLARRVVAENAFAVGGEVKLGFAAYAVLAGAIIGAPAWLKSFNGWTRAALFALSLLALLGWIAFRFLKIFYNGEPMVVDPALLTFLLTQAVEFGALALCCAAVAANSKTRRIALMILPALLLALAARYKTMPAAKEDD